MKNFTVIVLAIVLVTSCAFQSPVETGSITLTSPRGLKAVGADENTVLRYVLTRDGTVVPLNEQPALELVDSTTLRVTINGLLPGAGYRLALSVGTKPEQVLLIDYYGTSAEFSIAAGSNSEVAIDLSAAPDYRYLTQSGANSSATVVENTIYVLDGSRLLDYPSMDTASVPSTLTPGLAVTINSLSTGKYFGESGGIQSELWLNTSGGIYRDNGGVFEFNLNTGLTPNVLLSRAVKFENGESEDTIFGLYSGGGSVIGFASATTQADFSTVWYTLDNAVVEYPDYADLISGISTDIIKSIAVNSDHDIYYMATALGAVIGSEELKTLTDSVDFKNDPMGSINPYMLTAENGSVSIDVVSTAGDRVFAGTKAGLYTDTINTVSAEGKKLGAPATGLTKVPGTEDLVFSYLESYNLDDVVVTAAVTDDNDVLILKDGAVFKTLDAASGIPADAKAVFYEYEGTLHLILTGTNGSIDYDTEIAYTVLPS